MPRASVKESCSVSSMPRRGRIVPGARYVQLVGAAVYTVLSGSFDRLP